MHGRPFYNLLLYIQLPIEEDIVYIPTHYPSCCHRIMATRFWHEWIPVIVIRYSAAHALQVSYTHILSLSFTLRVWNARAALYMSHEYYECCSWLSWLSLCMPSYIHSYIFLCTSCMVMAHTRAIIPYKLSNLSANKVLSCCKKVIEVWCPLYYMHTLCQ